MPRWLKHFLFVIFLVVFGGCAGSCTGCSGCGMTPLPGGFPAESRIENSSSVRLTKSGLDFLSANIATLAPTLLGGQGSVNAGVVTFDVPPSAFDQSGFKGNVCPNGSNPASNPPECVVEADLGKAVLNIATAAPHNITVNGTLAVRLQKLPVKGTFLGFIPINVEAVLTKGANCSPKEYADIPVSIDISVEADDDPTHGARKGYSRIKIVKVEIDNNAISSSITFCGGGIDDAIVNLIKGFLIGSLIGGLTDTLTQTIDEQLCTKQDATTGATCPTGTYPDASDVCRYCQPDGTGKCPDSSAECVGIALGADGNIDLSAALSSLSPGTKGGFDFLAALGGEGVRDDGSGMLWGDLNPIGGGATVGMMGGAEPKPITQCVPIANLTKPTGIPIPDELADPTKLIDNGIPNWVGAGPHFGFAASERYINYALGAIYNSGALCLGVGSSTLGSLLNSDTISLLIPSFKDLARQKQAAPLALVVRPQQPPTVVVGKGTDLATDPSLEVTMNKLFIDFYVWSSDRFIRAFTASFDVVAPVNLDVTDLGLQPVLDQVVVTNPGMTNSLLREEEQAAAQKLADIVSGQIGTALGGAIAPVDISSQLAPYGLKLNIPPTVQGQGSPGLTKLEKGSDRFLGLFAGLETAPVVPAAIAPEPESDTSVELASKRVLPEGLSLPTITDDNAPSFELRVSSVLDDGHNPVEWQYRLNGGLWHPWTYSRTFTVRAPELSIQARHRVEVRSRISGKPASMDKTPAVLEVLVDKSAPSIELDRYAKGGKLGVHVRDFVSPKTAVEVRWALDDGSFGEWVLAEGLEQIEVGKARTVKVEAKDEEENVATTQHSLIRGKEDASLAGSGSACGCRLPGGAEPKDEFRWPAALFGLGLLLLARRRRTPAPGPERSVRGLRVAGTAAAMLVAASWSGCSCSDDSETGQTGTGGAAGGGGAGGAPACQGLPTCETLTPGLVGAYASAAVASDGTVWVAAYDDIGYGTSEDLGEVPYLFGDLVVGKWDGQKVAWQSVDGLPVIDPTLEPGDPGGPPDPNYNDPNGFRQGLTEPGDDVGMWTSIALAGDDPQVAYFDAKNRALKYATFDGSKWTAHTVQQKAQSDIGRYAKLLMVSGKPVVAFLAIEPTKDGAAQSFVRVASASSATPAAGADWTFVDAATNTATPCRAFTCATGSCRQDTGKCQATVTGCDPKCATDEKCFDDAGTKICQKVFAANTPDAYPEAAGLYVSLAQTKTGLGIVYYDRLHGNLMAVRQEAGKWQAPVLLDGQGTGPNGPVDTGDVGIGASLFVDTAGDWHVSYVNGFDETLVYLKLTGGTTAAAPEVVDNGVTTGGQAVVGDDSSIVVSATGEVQIAYQDATNGKARWATGKPNGATHTWTTKNLTVSDFAGAFSEVLTVGAQTQVLTWWRHAKPRTEGDVVIVTP